MIENPGALRAAWLFERVREAQSAVAYVALKDSTNAATAVTAFLSALATCRPGLEALVAEGLLSRIERCLGRHVAITENSEPTFAQLFARVSATSARWSLSARPPGYVPPEGRTALEPGSIAGAACRFLDERYSERLSVAALASIVGCPPARLTKAFVAEWGMDIGRYLLLVRTLRAIDLLVSTNLKIEVVALVTGFKNKTRFYSAIKKMTGMTPAKYRLASSAVSRN